MEDTPTRILIIDTAWLGDVVFTTALIAAVRSLWPASQIHALVAPRGLAILNGHPELAQIWVYDKHKTQKSVFALRALASQLRSINFDLVLNAHPSFRSRLLTAWVDAPTSVGYDGYLSSIAFTHTISGNLAAKPDHVARRLALLEPLVNDVPRACPLVAVTEDDLATARAFLEQHQARKPLLGLIAGSAWATKRWPANRYEALAERWLQETDGSVVVFCGETEAEIAKSIARVDNQRVIAAVQQPMFVVRALLKQCGVVVGNDTGLTFLASAVSGPAVIALYGSTQVNYAFPDPHLALHAGVPCCLSRYGHGANHCRWNEEGGAWCMKQIGVERVWEEVRRRMKDEG